MIPIDKIKDTVLKRHNIPGATDQQIMAVWNSIDDDTRHRYLEEDRKLNQEMKKNAVSDRHKSDV